MVRVTVILSKLPRYDYIPATEVNISNYLVIANIKKLPGKFYKFQISVPKIPISTSNKTISVHMENNYAKEKMNAFKLTVHLEN